MQVETGVARVRVRRQRQIGVESDDRHGQHHRPDPTDRPSECFVASECSRGWPPHERSHAPNARMGSTAATLRAMERPPSVDALARSLAGSGCRTPLLVDVARPAIADGAVADAPARADALRRTLLTPVVNATGVLLHTNLGRAPLAHHQAAQAAVASSSTWPPASAARASARSAQLFARLCGAEAAIVVNNNAAAVLLVLAALAAGRDVPVSRGESVEIGGGFRVPEVMEQSGARLVDVGTTNRTRLADYRRARRSAERRRRAGAEGAPQQLPRRRLRRGDVGRASWRRSDVPVVVDIGSGLIDATCPWLAGPHPPAWLAGEPAAAPDARRRRRARDVQRRQAARRSAGRHHRRARRSRRALRRATRWPGRCGPAASCSRALQELALAYLRRDVVATVPFWRMVATPVADLRRPGRRRSPPPTGTTAVRHRRAARAPGRRPGRRSRRPACASTATTSPRCAPTIRRSSPGPATARPWLDLRTVDPSDDAIVAAALGRPLTPRDAGRRHRRPRRPRQVVARARADRHRPRPLRRGEAPRPDDRPRLRPHRAPTASRSASSTCPATCGSCATCWPASAASTPACSWSPPPRAGSRRARSTCGSSSCSASATASSR